MKISRPIVIPATALLPWPLMFAFALLLSGAGCIAIPWSESDSGRTRNNLNADTPKQFGAGTNTRKDVIFVLGEPDVVSPDELRLGYRVEKNAGVWLSLGPRLGDNPEEGTILTEHYYFFDFDVEGRLQQISPSTTRITRFEDLIPPPAAGLGTRRLPGIPDNEPIWKVHEDCIWHPGVNGYRRLDGLRGEKTKSHLPKVPGRLFITESNVVFFSNAQFANADPVLKLPMSSLAETRADTDGPDRLLVVRTKVDEVHSFAIYRSTGFDFDAMMKDSEFIRSKIEPARPGQ